MKTMAVETTVNGGREVSVPTGEQIVRLINLLNSSLAHSLLDRERLDYLLNHAPDFEAEMIDLLQRSVQPIILSKPFFATINHALPLEDVLTGCGFHAFHLDAAKYFTDPPVPAAKEYWVMTLRDGIKGSDILDRLSSQGFRPATLREVACLLQMPRSFLETYSSLTVYGSHGIVQENLIPHIKRVRQRIALGHITTERYIRAGTCHVVVAAQPH